MLLSSCSCFVFVFVVLCLLSFKENKQYKHIPPTTNNNSKKRMDVSPNYMFNVFLLVFLTLHVYSCVCELIGDVCC